MDASNAPTACENCATPLQGRYCHACGQSVVNPLHHAGHALEEFFESFWHLDGRAGCTLRDLLHPGRVALEYINGHRARYIPPLRMFLVLSVLTFFLAKLLLPGDDAVQVGTGADPQRAAQTTAARGTATKDFASARTAAQVEAVLRRELADLAEARRTLPLMAPAFAQAARDLRAQARKRPVELGASTASIEAATASAHSAPPNAAAQGKSTAKPDAKPEGINVSVDSEDWPATVQSSVNRMSIARLRTPSKPWDAATNPVSVSRWPDFANRRLNHTLQNVGRNIQRAREEPNFVQSHMIAAVPSALFVMVPVFALLLKLLYLRSRRGYLEHLVVGLYSHAFLLLALTLIFVLVAIQAATSGIVYGAFGVALFALAVWMPVYLLLMQKRVYAQGWVKTSLKYLILGFVYMFLIVGVMLYAVFSAFIGS